MTDKPVQPEEDMRQAADKVWDECALVCDDDECNRMLGMALQTQFNAGVEAAAEVADLKDRLLTTINDLQTNYIKIDGSTIAISKLLALDISKALFEAHSIKNKIRTLIKPKAGEPK